MEVLKEKEEKHEEYELLLRRIEKIEKEMQRLSDMIEGMYGSMFPDERVVAR